METIDCVKLTPNEFNCLGEEVGVSAISDDKVVDKKDAFVLEGDDGTSKIVRWNHPSVQSVMKLWKTECASERKRLQGRGAMAQAFGVTFGDPKAMVRCPCEQIGIYRDGEHLFDVYSFDDVVKGGNPEKRNAFTDRHLASVIAKKLKVDVPKQYRAKLTISAKDRRALEKQGVRFDEGKEKLRTPNGLDFLYGGALAYEGFNTEVKITVLNGTMVRFDFIEDDGDSSSAMADLATGKLYK